MTDSVSLKSEVSLKRCDRNIALLTRWGTRYYIQVENLDRFLPALIERLKTPTTFAALKKEFSKHNPEMIKKAVDSLISQGLLDTPKSHGNPPKFAQVICAEQNGKLLESVLASGPIRSWSTVDSSLNLDPKSEMVVLFGKWSQAEKMDSIIEQIRRSGTPVLWVSWHYFTGYLGPLFLPNSSLSLNALFQNWCFSTGTEEAAAALVTETYAESNAIPDSIVSDLLGRHINNQLSKWFNGGPKLLSEGVYEISLNLNCRFHPCVGARPKTNG